MVKKNKRFATMGFLLIVVFLVEMSYSQNQKAEDLFSDYHKWGVFGQLNNFEEAEVSPTNNVSLTYELFATKRAAIGINYNFYQKNNWNFKVSLSLQWLGNEGGYTILEPENPTSNNIGLFYQTENDKLAYLQTSAEYILYSRGRFGFSVDGGFGLTFYEFLGDEAFETQVNGEKLFSFEYASSEKPLYLSGNIQGNIYYKSKHFLLQTSLTYKKSFKSFRTGSYEFTNLELSPDVSGSINQSGDYFGLGLTIYFKKKAK